VQAKPADGGETPGRPRRLLGARGRRAGWPFSHRLRYVLLLRFGREMRRRLRTGGRPAAAKVPRGRAPIKAGFAAARSVRAGARAGPLLFLFLFSCARVWSMRAGLHARRKANCAGVCNRAPRGRAPVPCFGKVARAQPRGRGRGFGEEWGGGSASVFPAEKPHRARHGTTLAAATGGARARHKKSPLPGPRQNRKGPTWAGGKSFRISPSSRLMRIHKPASFILEKHTGGSRRRRALSSGRCRCSRRRRARARPRRPSRPPGPP
jgi:hypothetical protein